MSDFLKPTVVVKGRYLFKSEALDQEREEIFDGPHSWDDVYRRYHEWLQEIAEGSIEELSYTETRGKE